MPWDAKSFAARHNKKLAGYPETAAKEARMATGMVEKGMDEGKAIRIANAAGDKAIGFKTANYARSSAAGRKA